MSEETKRPTPTEFRRSILREAEKCVCQDRQSSHGDAEDNFKVIADFWSAYLSKASRTHISVSREDVAAMMVLLRVARAAHNPGNRDNWVDMSGYAACGGGIVDGKFRTEVDQPSTRLVYTKAGIGGIIEKTMVNEGLKGASL